MQLAQISTETPPNVLFRVVAETAKRMTEIMRSTTPQTIRLESFLTHKLLKTHGACSVLLLLMPWSHFYQTRSAWSVNQGSTDNHSPVNNFAPTVTKFCVMREGQALPHDTKFGNCRDKIVYSKVFPSWSLIHGSSWSGLIKVEPGAEAPDHRYPLCWLHIHIYTWQESHKISYHLQFTALKKWKYHFKNDNPIV